MTKHGHKVKYQTTYTQAVCYFTFSPSSLKNFNGLRTLLLNMQSFHIFIHFTKVS